MSKQARRRQHRPTVASNPAAPSFTPVPVRARHDGWTAVRQAALIRALADTANVEEACAAVGMSPRSAYTLKSRSDAASFRQAWDAALDYGVHRLADAMLGRAMHGVATPVFYRGEQIGERRTYDARLGMFILRARAPERYGKWRDNVQANRQHPDGAALIFHHALAALNEDNVADAAGKPRPRRAPLKTMWLLDDPAERSERETQQAREADARREAGHRAFMSTLDGQTGLGLYEEDRGDDVA